MLTGNKNLDLVILNKLNDIDLVNVCQTNHQANELCNDQKFWLNRIMITFPYLDLDLLKQYKGDRSWSQYYIKDLRQIKPNNTETYLRHGTLKGRLDQVTIAVNKGGDIHLDEDTPITFASEKGHLDIVKYLVGLGADINTENNSPVRFASYYGHLDVVKYLVEQGADIRADNDYAIKWAKLRGHFDVVDYLVSIGAPDPR